MNEDVWQCNFGTSGRSDWRPGGILPSPLGGRALSSASARARASLSLASARRAMQRRGSLARA